LLTYRIFLALLAGAALPGPSAVATPPPTISSIIGFWTAPTPPFRVVGPIYYVGTLGLGIYLIATPAGHVLIDAGLPQGAPGLVGSIDRLGFSAKDIRIILITHAHFDHAGGLAHLKAASGAEIAVMEGDRAALASGGRTDPIFGGLPSRQYPPVTPDRILKDGDTISVGGVTLSARLGAGHTPGATTWVTDVEEGGTSYRVVFPCCTSINAGMVLTGRDAAIPGIADDYRRTFEMLQSLAPDIALPGHTETFDFERRRLRAARVGAGGWVDREGYRAWIAGARARFEAVVAGEAATR
jgi:metallo-beta-lactamase class B